MIERTLRRIARLTLGHPWAVLCVVLLLSVGAYLKTRQLAMRTDLMEVVGGRTAEDTRILTDAVQTLGYGNQLFVIIETPGGTEADGEAMEQAAERLVHAMLQSGQFKYARDGLSDEDVLAVVRLYARHFLSFVDERDWAALGERLQPEAVRRHVKAAAAALVTPFSSLAEDYFVADPLGLLEFTGASGVLGSSLTVFDRDWGSGNRFFSRDHTALLVVAEPRWPATDYASALDVVSWTRRQTRALTRDPVFAQRSLHATLAGAHVYTDENRRLIERNVWVASTVSIAGNLILCLVVYRWLPLLLLAVIPTTLGILWTTGLISVYPGEINLISLAFIAILAGLGDDQVTYFFSRVPDEVAKGRSRDDAVTVTYLTTGRSVLFCVMTTGLATLSIALARFKGLSELGVILTIGLVMLLLHTLFTVPALMKAWSKWGAASNRRQTFRVLPQAASVAAHVVRRWPIPILTAAGVTLVIAVYGMLGRGVIWSNRAFASSADAALAGQRALAERFGMEGAPTVLLVEGDRDSVLRRVELLTQGLAPLAEHGVIRSFFSPSAVLPSLPLQQRRRASVKPALLLAAAGALEGALREEGFVLTPFEPALANLRALATGAAPPMTLDEVLRAFPEGTIDTSIRKVNGERYVAAVTLYSARAAAAATLTEDAAASLRRLAGSFIEFSYETVGRDVQERLAIDSRRALLLSVLGITVVVVAGFRSVRLGALVLLPIGYAAFVTIGGLAVAGHRFTGMALSAVPLIVGIGIDNGIHLVRRYLESTEHDVGRVIEEAGAPLILTNLTTMIGFGALMTSTFPPLAELGLITAAGLVISLFSSLLIVPALLMLPDVKKWSIWAVGSRSQDF